MASVAARSCPNSAAGAALVVAVAAGGGAGRPAEGRALVGSAELGRMQAAVDDFMAAYFAAARPTYAEGVLHTTLYDDAAEFVCRPGKRLRPLLFLLAHRVFQREGSPAVTGRDLLAVGASLELLHGFILIHDDIIDRSETRRGRPTLHRVLEARLPAFADRSRTGKNLSLVLGDILFALAQQCLLEAESVPAALRVQLGRLLLGCLMETGFGEAADILYGSRDISKLTLAEIERMYLLKTTRYTIECPLAMGATLAGADPAAVACLEAVARPAGLAFQIQNDLLEFARFEVSDLDVPADILEGKKTVLVHTAFEMLGETDRGLLQLCFSAAGPSDATVSKARELISKSGAVTRLRRRIEDLLREAEGAVRATEFGPAEQAGLAGLLRMVRDAADRAPAGR